MFGTLKGRIALLALMTLLAAVSLIRNGISLGLDLRGGMHLALEIDDPDNTYTDEAKADFIDQTLYVLRNRIDQFGVAEPVVQKVGSERIIVELPGIDDEERARGIIEQQAFLEWKLVRPSTDLTNPLQRMDRLVTAALRERGALPAETTAAADTTAATDTTQRRETVQDLLFGRADTAAADTATAPSERPLSSLIYSTGSQGEFVVAEQDVQRVKEYLSLPGVIGALPRGAELRWGAVPTGQGAQLYRPLYILEREPFITGDRLENATAGRDPQFNQTIVSFQLDRRGGNTFEQITSRHIGDRIAIVLDTLVHSAPTVEGRIGSSGQITMGAGASMQEASDLALVLRAGSLPAGITIVEQRSIGPSLGQDSIDQGKLAGIIGILFVITLMIVYYRLAGALAVLALCFYLLFVLGGLAGFGANLTAPGIAGLILSLGMAVDANVLIFERIREELLAGRSTRAAVDAGFQHAMSAIVDSNITTLFTALILFRVGTGPVQGFAVTLSIGIVASFVTAVFITRTFFLIYLDRKRAADPISI
jgi:preprotein translocase subunit SecD